MLLCLPLLLLRVPSHESEASFPLRETTITVHRDIRTLKCDASLNTFFLSNGEKQFILNYSFSQKKNVCLRVFRICSSLTTCLPSKSLKCLRGFLVSSKTPVTFLKLSWMIFGYGKDIIFFATSCSGKPYNLRHFKCQWEQWDHQKQSGKCLLT